MKSIYDFFMIPLEKMGIRHARKHLLSSLSGNILEIGAGTGANAPFYDYDQISLIVSDYKLHKKVKAKYPETTQIVQASVEELPFEDETFDCVVESLVFCSVQHVDIGLEEIYRVLKPNGRLVFIEHVEPKRNPLKRIFNILTPFWRKIASNCHLNRDYINALKRKGFSIESHFSFGKEIFVYGTATKGAKA